MSDVDQAKAVEMRVRIVAANPLTNCFVYVGDVMQRMPNLVRIAMYRLDGRIFGEELMGSALTNLVLLRQATPPFRELNAHYMKHFGFGCPRIGYSLVLKGAKDHVVAQCDVLANTDFLDSDSSRRVTGHSISSDGVDYRVYFYWST